MSFATDTLTIAEQAYQDALTGKSTQLNGRRLEKHDIDALRAELLYWQQVVKDEAAQTAGQSVNHAIQVIV